MTKKIKSLVVIVVAAVLILGVSQAAYAVPGGCPDEGAMPMNIGPLNPISGFPLWAQDSTGLTVEVCLDPLLCISSPPIPGNAFSQQIGFGAEGFMASAETSITTNVGLDALLVTAVELAFLTEDPIDGDQFPFTRLRIRVDVPVAGIYTVTHPYGRQVFIIEEADLGPGQEIRESFDISFVADTVHQGRIGPILRWDMDLPVLDANGEEYIGDLAVPHTVTGSPCGTNFFRIEAVELDGITPIDLGSGLGNPVTETLFTVTGKVFTGVAPTPLVANRTTYARQAGGNGQVDVFATSAPTAGVTFSGGLNLPVGERPLIGDGNGAFFTSVTLADASTLPATVSVTANNAGNDQTTLIN
ncbi:MAG: hypothetical protein OEM19_01720, partial [Deltaproteobacteria bacterium]|nr:hypothetical protein [Deltaproteobacteria bacterium]